MPSQFCKIYINQVTIEYLIPFTTGRTWCGYVKLDGNKTIDPAGGLIAYLFPKNANSPPT